MAPTGPTPVTAPTAPTAADAPADGADGAGAWPDRELIVHLGMTGRFFVEAPSPPTVAASPYLRARWALDDGNQLTFTDVRRFGRIAVVERGHHESLPTLDSLGPEPFDDAFSPEWLRLNVNRSVTAVKTQLLSQRVVAGVGNIYADEALWRAHVHPRARRLTIARSVALRDAIRDVLAEGLAHGGTTFRDYRDADGSEGSPSEQPRLLRSHGRTVSSLRDHPATRSGRCPVLDLLSRLSAEMKLSQWANFPPERRN